VTKEIYALFVQEENTNGRHHPTPGEGPNGESSEAVDDNEPAVGMWASDAVRFVDWVNGLFDDGTAVRLPTREELEDPAIGLVTTRHSVWAQADPRPLLHCPNTLPNPYLPQADQIRRFPTGDRRQTSGHLLATLTLARSDGLARALDYDFALDLDRALENALDFDRALNLSLDLALDQERAVGLAHALTRALDHESALKADHMRMLVVAYSILITLWMALGNKNPKIGKALANFDAFLESILPKISVTAPTLPEDVAESILRTRALLGASSNRPLSDRDDALRKLAWCVTSDVHDLVAPMLTRSAPYDPDAIPSARIGLLAVAAVISHLHGRPSNEEDRANTLICNALRGLTAVQERANSNLVANEVLILARA
jgi:hypothetical protein